MRSFLLFITISVAHAQFVPGRYIVEVTDAPAISDPAVSKRSGVERTAALQDTHNRAVAAKSQLRTALANVGVSIVNSTEIVANTFTIQADEATVQALLSSPGVARVRKVRLLKRNLNRATALHGAPAVWNRIGAENTGAGIRIGIIDSGIDAQHPAFRDESLIVPPGFPRVNEVSDTSFTNQKVIVARSYASRFVKSDPDMSARDRVGHGTALAMAAAGVRNTGPLATISGMAPKAFLGSYKVFGSPGVNDTAPEDAVLRAIEDAVIDGMDVINLSFGTLLASRPEDDILVRALNRAEALGVVAVVSAGNDGPEPNTISSPATSTSSIAVGASANDRIFSSAAVVSGGPTYRMTAGERSAELDALGGLMRDVATLDEDGRACSPLPSGSLTSRIALILRGVCTFEEKLNNAQGAGAMAALVYTNREQPQAITMAVGGATLPAGMISFIDGQTLSATLANGVPLETTLQFRAVGVDADSLAMGRFSSGGPGAGLTIKPDLVAVGTSLYTATQTYDAEGDMYNRSGYITVQGTSFSAPLVAGAAALVKGVRPGLSPAEYRSLLVNAAQPFPSSEAAGIQQAGSGRLDVDAATKATLAVQPVTLGFGAEGIGGLLSRQLTIKNISSAPEVFEVSVVAVTGAATAWPSQNVLSLQPGESMNVVISLDVPIVASGVSDGFVVLRRVSDNMLTRVPYWFAVRSREPASIVMLFAAGSETADRNVSDLLVFRVLDRSGVALRDIEPTITIVSGTASITRVQLRDDEAADAFSVDMRLGQGTNTLRIDAGGISKEVTIVGRVVREEGS